MKNYKAFPLLILGQLLLSAGLATAESAAYSQLSGSAHIQPPAAPAPYLSDSKSIYGDNSMQEYYQVSDQLKKLADSSVAFMLKTDLDFDPVEKVYKAKKIINLTQTNYADESEDFSQQGILPGCSGSYLGKGLVMTAGHCFSVKPGDPTYSENFYMVFGWKYGSEGSPEQSFPADAVYTIKKVEAYALEGKLNDMTNYRDFALVSMDREPLDRQPLVIDGEHAPKVGQKVFTIGYPLGLAVKIDNPDHAQVYAVEKNLFQTNIDAFSGNSGGPAFDSATNKIVGIVVTATGANYSYELNQDLSFVADFTLPTDSLKVDAKEGIAYLGVKNRTAALELFRGNGATVKLLDEVKCLITLPKGSKFEPSNLNFTIATRIAGKKVFNKGRLIRNEQDSFGTGVMRLPEEIKNLVQP